MDIVVVIISVSRDHEAVMLGYSGGAGSEPPPSKVPFKGGLKGPSPGGHEGEKGLKPP